MYIQKHRPPLASIPCLHYQREKDKETGTKEDKLQGSMNQDGEVSQDVHKDVTKDTPDGQIGGLFFHENLLSVLREGIFFIYKIFQR